MNIALMSQIYKIVVNDATRPLFNSIFDNFTAPMANKYVDIASSIAGIAGNKASSQLLDIGHMYIGAVKDGLNIALNLNI